MPDLPCQGWGGGGGNPTSVAQNDTHVALIILTTQMWGGGELLVEKTFWGQNLCSCAFGANIRSYTKQRARHGTPFLQPPPPPSEGVHVTPPPPPPQNNFQVAMGCAPQNGSRRHLLRPAPLPPQTVFTAPCSTTARLWLIPLPPLRGPRVF